MLPDTESVLPSPVSARDVSDYSSPSCNIPFDQYKAIRDSFGVPFESAKISVAMAKVFITMNGSQEAALTQEHNLVEQSLVHWCNTGRTEFIAKYRDAQEVLQTCSDGNANIQSQDREKLIQSAWPIIRPVASILD